VPLLRGRFVLDGAGVRFDEGAILLLPGGDVRIMEEEELPRELLWDG
jgi:hypothetical protein